MPNWAIVMSRCMQLTERYCNVIGPRSNSILTVGQGKELQLSKVEKGYKEIIKQRPILKDDNVGSETQVLSIREKKTYVKSFFKGGHSLTWRR